MTKHTRVTLAEDVSPSATSPKLPEIKLAKAFSLDLPSRFNFYSFKELYGEPFKTKHITKLMQGQYERSLSTLVEVVDSVLSTPTGETRLAYELTYEDYVWVLYWLRLNSFTKNRMQVKYTCKNPEHIQKVESGEMPKESLKLVSIVETSSLTTDYLEKVSFNKNNFLPNCELPEGFRIDVPRMKDVLAMSEDPRMFITVQGEQVPDAGYMRQASLSMMINWNNASWNERYDFVGELSPDDFDTMMSLGKDIPAYGVKEYVTIRCPRCGAQYKVKTSIDARSFFLPSR